MCIHLLDGKTVENKRKLARLRKLTWMERIIWKFLSRKLKLKTLLKYLKSKKVSARNFDCGECCKNFCLRELIEKSRGKAHCRRLVGLEETRFEKPRPNSLKYFRWKLKTTPEIPGMFLHLTAYLFCVCFTHVSANKIYWTLHKAKLTAVKRPNLLDRD